MSTNTETLNKKLYRYLSKYKPKPLDTDGEVTPLEDEADVFKFTFTVDGESYGTAFASVDDDTKLSLYYGDDVGESPKWLDFVEELKIWKNLNGFGKWEAKDMDQLQGDMTRRKHMRNKDKIAEGYYPMGKRASYSDSIPSVKIVIEHSRTIEEGEQRYRNINRIFLENQLGERYLLDTKKPGIARVYARHIAEGGKVNDDRWSHIGSLCEEYQKMAGFVRATRNGQFNESAQQLVNEGLAHYQSLRESLSRLTGKRGYNAYFENWTPQLMEDNVEENNLNELFVQETLDPRIESVMPILNRIHKKVSESVVDKEINKLAEWADSLTEAEGESIQSNNPVGIPESLEEHSPVVQAITRRILMQHPDLLQKYGPEKVGDAIDSVAEFVGDVEEIGSSDVSGWVKQVAQSLGGHEGVAESERQLGRFSGAWQILVNGKKVHSFRGNFDQETADRVGVVKAASRGLYNPGSGDKIKIVPVMLDQKQGVAEDLDANQKRVGQLGPTTPVGKNEKNLRGMAVGTNENFINSTSQAVTTEDEMDEGEHTQHAMRGRNPGANEFEHDFEPEDKVGNIHDKISKMLKRLAKPEHEPNMKDTDIGSTVLDEMDKSQPSSDRGGESSGDPYAKGGKATPIKAKDAEKDVLKTLNKSMDKEHKKDVNESEERPYVCVHAKKGKCEVKASSSYQAAQKAAQKWGLKSTAGIDAHLADVTHDASTLEEGQEDLDAILRIIRR